MILIDSHCHLFDIKNYELPPDIFPVVVGYSHSSNKKTAALGKLGYPIALGIAPQTALKEGIENMDQWIEFIRGCTPNAIGEVGLDYKWAKTEEHIQIQRTLFERMIELADEMKLPLVIHSRNNPQKDSKIPINAISEAVEMLSGRKFLMHFYSGDEEQAKRILDLGGHISIIHMRSKERRKVINAVPIESLLMESDSPYVGRTPDSIREALVYIAQIKEMDVETVAQKTTENAMKFFNFKIDLGKKPYQKFTQEV